MQVCAPARLPRLGVGHDTVPGHHEAKQAGLRRTRFAANTGTRGFFPVSGGSASAVIALLVYRVAGRASSPPRHR